MKILRSILCGNRFAHCARSPRSQLHSCNRAWCSLWAMTVLLPGIATSGQLQLESQDEKPGEARNAPTPDDQSGIQVDRLSTRQIANLVLLGKVWGFLKYHHPAVTSGSLDWDRQLFQTLPAVLRAPNSTAAQTALVDWIDRLGPIAACSLCAELDSNNLSRAPDLDWIQNKDRLGGALSERLQTVLRNRIPTKQHYVALVRGVGNPQFLNEKAYPRSSLPDSGLQLLSLFRFWNVVEYWYPYRDLVGDAWDADLTEFIPRVTLAATPESFQLELMALVARIQDSHSNLWSSINLRPPTGACQLPLSLRFVQDELVVESIIAPQSEGPEVGDVVREIDSASVPTLVRRLRPYYAASNEVVRARDIARSLTRGECDQASLLVKRGSRNIRMYPERIAVSGLDMRSTVTNDLPGPAFRHLSPDIVYLKLSSIKSAELDDYIKQSAGTKAMIVDARGYPAEFVALKLGSSLVDKETAFARFTTADLSNPGAFHWTDAVTLKPAPTSYAGSVVALVDESTQSQGEYTVMALRASPRSRIVGSTTAGADGNVSRIELPGGLWALISGIGVYYPDHKPTQRIGIVPDVQVSPTISGIRTGKDEVLEAAVREIK